MYTTNIDFATGFLQFMIHVYYKCRFRQWLLQITRLPRALCVHLNPSVCVVSGLGLLRSPILLQVLGTFRKLPLTRAEKGRHRVPRGQNNSRPSRLEENWDAMTNDYDVGGLKHAPKRPRRHRRHRRRHRRRRKTCPVITASTYRRNPLFSKLTQDGAAKHHASTMQALGLFLFSRRAWELRNYFRHDDTM